MASFNQDFRKFQKDTFEIVFTITDATDISDYAALWMAYPSIPDDYPGDATAPINSPTIQKGSNQNSQNYFTTVTGDNTGITMGTTTVTIQINQSDFNGNSITGKLYEAEWYHELVLGPTNNASDSVVAAIGTMTISPSLFTNNEFRW